MNSKLNMSTPIRLAWIALIALVITSLACNFGLSAPQPERTPAPLSTEALQEMEQNLSETLEEAQQTGDLTLTLTEGQVTSYLAERLAQEPDSPLSEPLVLFQENQIEVYGKVKSGPVSGSVQIVLTVSVDANGSPDVEIISANLGAIPLPQFVLDQITTMIDDLIQENMASLKAQLVDIQVTTGLMILTARLQ